MNKLLLCIFTVCFLLSCSKTTPPSTPATPTTPSTPNTPATPVTPSTPVAPISLSHPIPLDTLYDWVRIGRVANDLEDIWFTANNVGFITNDNSLFMSRDNGNTWTPIPNTTFANIFNLQFVDNQNGFVQGNNELGITNDGGNTWVFKLLPSNSAEYFQFVNATTGFYLDPSKGLYKTYDAGNNWTSIPAPQFQQYQQNFPFYFLDSLTGFSMNNGNFNKLTNGGLSSAVITSNVTTYSQGYYKMQFIDSSTGFSATPKGLIKTIDGGKTWITCLASSSSLTSSFMIPYFLDSNNGYCIDRNIIYKTINGGLSWTISCQLTKDSFSGFHFLDMNTGWASTFGGYVLRLK